MENPQTSRLFYYGTDTEVRIGDRIMISHWFRRNEYATVCYIPGLSKKNNSLEYEDVRRWAYRMDDGTIRARGYYPDEQYGQQSKNIHFVSRGEGGALRDDEGDDDEDDDVGASE